MTFDIEADWTLGVLLIPKAIRGSYQGRWYPQAYTEAERTQFRRMRWEIGNGIAAFSQPGRP